MPDRPVPPPRAVGWRGPRASVGSVGTGAVARRDVGAGVGATWRPWLGGPGASARHPGGRGSAAREPALGTPVAGVRHPGAGALRLGLHPAIRAPAERYGRLPTHPAADSGRAGGGSRSEPAGCAGRVPRERHRSGRSVPRAQVLQDGCRSSPCRRTQRAVGASSAGSGFLQDRAPARPGSCRTGLCRTGSLQDQALQDRVIAAPGSAGSGPGRNRLPGPGTHVLRPGWHRQEQAAGRAHARVAARARTSRGTGMFLASEAPLPDRARPVRDAPLDGGPTPG